MNRDSLCGEIVTALAQLDEAQRNYSVQAATYVSSCWGSGPEGLTETPTGAESIQQLRTMRAQVVAKAEHFERVLESLGSSRPVGLA